MNKRKIKRLLCKRLKLSYITTNEILKSFEQLYAKRNNRKILKIRKGCFTECPKATKSTILFYVKDLGYVGLLLHR